MKKSRVLISILVVSIIVLAGVVSYIFANKPIIKTNAGTNNSINKDVSEQISEDIEIDRVSSSEVIPVNALVGSNNIDCNEETLQLTAYVETENDSGVVVTPDTFGSDAFIEIVLIGYDVTEIHDGSFSNLINLKEIRVDSRNPYYSTYDGCLYNKDFSVLYCIPQNTTKVSVLNKVKCYTPHALDGLAQSRRDKLDSLINGTLYAENNETSSNNGEASIGQVGNYSQQSTANTEDKKQQSGNKNQQSKNENQPPVKENNSDSDNSAQTSESIANQEITVPITAGPSRTSSTDFSKYVFTDNGYTCFKYTGSSDTEIIIPDGVQKIYGFCENNMGFNEEITYVYIPKSVVSMRSSNMYNKEEYNWDNNLYNMLYQCVNLQTVESDAYSYVVDNEGVYRPAEGNKIYVWSKSKRIPYDIEVYKQNGVLK